MDPLHLHHVRAERHALEVDDGPRDGAREIHAQFSVRRAHGGDEILVSAVVGPVPRDGSTLAKLIALNPLVPIIGAYRDCIVYGRLPEFGAFSYSVAVAIVMVVVGWMLFRRASYKFAECI